MSLFNLIRAISLSHVPVCQCKDFHADPHVGLCVHCRGTAPAHHRNSNLGPDTLRERLEKSASENAASPDPNADYVMSELQKLGDKPVASEIAEVLAYAATPEDYANGLSKDNARLRDELQSARDALEKAEYTIASRANTKDAEVGSLRKLLSGVQWDLKVARSEKNDLQGALTIAEAALKQAQDDAETFHTHADRLGAELTEITEVKCRLEDRVDALEFGEVVKDEQIAADKETIEVQEAALVALCKAVVEKAERI